MGEFLPVVPVALGTTVLDRDNRVGVAQPGIEIDQFLAADLFAGALLESVSAVPVVELATRDIEREKDFLAQFVPRALGSLLHAFEGVIGTRQRRREAA